MTESFHAGVSIFFSDINKPALKDEKCLACGILMRVDQGKHPRSWASALANHVVQTWIYLCPMVGKEGHDHLHELYREWESLKSEKLKTIVAEELRDKRKVFKEKHQ